MHTRPRIPAEPRSDVRKKSALRALRRTGQVPASLFGHGDPQLIQVPARALQDFLRYHPASGIVDLALDNAATPAVIREIDRHPVTGEVIHLGLQRVDLGETIKASLPLAFTGEETLTGEGLVLERQLEKIEVHARADALPESLAVDVSHTNAGHSIRIGDLHLPAGVETSMSPDLPVATISTPSLPADVAAALDAEEIAHAELVASHGTADEEEELTEAAA
jgi:large subunit ribosomal protein L25